MSARVRRLNTNTDSVGFIDPVKATETRQYLGILPVSAILNHSVRL